jgi:hypothetical protein
MEYILIAIAAVILIAIIAKAASSSKKKGEAGGKTTLGEIVASAAPAPAASMDPELVAVISAALAAFMADAPVEGLVVRSIRRVPSGRPAWGKAALKEQLGQRF